MRLMLPQHVAGLLSEFLESSIPTSGVAFILSQIPLTEPAASSVIPTPCHTALHPDWNRPSSYQAPPHYQRLVDQLEISSACLANKHMHPNQSLELGFSSTQFP